MMRDKDKQLVGAELPSLSFSITRHVSEGVLESVELVSKGLSVDESLSGLAYLLCEYDKRKEKVKGDFLGGGIG
jgi:hypothetical protein